MAITIVQSGTGTDPGQTGTNPNITAPFPSPNNAGNLLFYCEGSYQTTEYINTFGDSQSNYWQPVPSDFLLSGHNVYAKACVSAKNGVNSISGVMSGSSTFSFDFAFCEVQASPGLVWSLDGAPFTTANGTGTTVTSSTITTLGSNNIIFAYFGTNTHQAPNVAGWTKLALTPYGSQLYYKVVTAPGSYNFTTPITSDTWVVSIFSFTATTPNTYYVNALTGSDSNAGTLPSTAWQSLARVNAHPFVAGDTVLLAAGQTFTGNLQITSGGGVPGSPINFGSYGNGVATISTGAGPHGIYVYNCGYVNIQNINLSGPSLGSASGNGIYCFTDQTNVTYAQININNVNVTGYTVGIYINGSSAWHVPPGNGFNGVRITNSTAFANSDNGILVSNRASSGTHSNIYIGYCSAFSNPGIAASSPWGGSGIFIGQTTNGTIEYCIAYSNGATGHGGVGIWLQGDNNSVIQFCESYNNSSTGFDGDGFDLDGECQNCTIQYCYSHGNKGAGFLVVQYNGARTWTTNIVRYNISENDQTAGIQISGASGFNVISAAIYNNTIYNSVIGCLIISNAFITTSTVTNNIFVTGNTKNLVSLPTGSLPGITFANNDYFALTGTFQISWNGTVYTTLASWGQDATGLISNPTLKNAGNGGTVGNIGSLPTLNAYLLLSGSPMISAGASITSPGSRDFYGNPIYYSGQVDVGAHEFVPALVPAAPGPISLTGHYNFWAGGFN